MIWAADFVPSQALEIPEYFVYCGIFKVRSWDKRCAQIAKGSFLDTPFKRGGGQKLSSRRQVLLVKRDQDLKLYNYRPVLFREPII